MTSPAKFSLRRKVALAALAALILVVPAAGADFSLRLISQTNSRITLGWDAQQGVAAYVFYANGQRVSHTFDGSRTSVTFSKVSGCSSSCYGVEDLRSDGISTYPTAPTPPPPTAKITQTIVAGSTITSIANWRAVYDANNDGNEDDPGSVEFLVDGTRILTEETPPFGDSFADGTYAVANGSHAFRVRALSGTTVLAENTVTATVQSSAPPPPPPPTGFPDASNTGIPEGTTLTAYLGPTTITTPGTVIENRTIASCLGINAQNVVIRRSRINCPANIVAVQVGSSASVTIEDSEISCQNRAGSHGVAYYNATVLRTEITACENGLSVNGNVTVRDSYIHALSSTGAAHSDGMQFERNTPNVQIIHNTIFGQQGPNDTGAGTSSLIADLPGHSDWLIENNLFGGGAWTVYCVDGKGTNWVIRNNAFTTRFNPKVGFFGHSTDCSDETQSGNYILETGEQIRLG